MGICAFLKVPLLDLTLALLELPYQEGQIGYPAEEVNWDLEVSKIEEAL